MHFIRAFCSFALHAVLSRLVHSFLVANFRLKDSHERQSQPKLKNKKKNKKKQEQVPPWVDTHCVSLAVQIFNESNALARKEKKREAKKKKGHTPRAPML